MFIKNVLRSASPPLLVDDDVGCFATRRRVPLKTAFARYWREMLTRHTPVVTLLMRCIAQVREVGDVVEITTKKQKQLTKRELEIMDRSTIAVRYVVPCWRGAARLEWGVRNSVRCCDGVSVVK